LIDLLLFNIKFYALSTSRITSCCLI